jgi:hypothetical protein
LIFDCDLCFVLFCLAAGPSARVRPTGQNRVIIEGLPSGTSWQDLKDFMKKPADVAFCDVTDGGRNGWVEYRTEDDMERAIKEMDGTKYRGADSPVKVFKVCKKQLVLYPCFMYHLQLLSFVLLCGLFFFLLFFFLCFSF